jgi:hypothetical protein
MSKARELLIDAIAILGRRVASATTPTDRLIFLAARVRLDMLLLRLDVARVPRRPRDPALTLAGSLSRALKRRGRS